MGAPKGRRPRVWVFPHDERKTDAYMKYLRSKAQAKYRMEHWDLTFDQWWNSWESSGKYDERTNDKHGYCMIQSDPDLGWIEENLLIISREQHLKTQHQRRQTVKNKVLTWDPDDLKFRLPTGLNKVYKGKRSYGQGD